MEKQDKVNSFQKKNVDVLYLNIVYTTRNDNKGKVKCQNH